MLDIGQSREIWRRKAAGPRFLLDASCDGAEFWNKGDEALLVIGDRRYECRRVD